MRDPVSKKNERKRERKKMHNESTWYGYDPVKAFYGI